MILNYRYRIKDRSARKTLMRMAYACNQVWNYCCAQQRDVEDRYRAGARKRKWATHFDLTYLTKGVGAELGIPQNTVGDVCRQFAHSRNQNSGAPRFRSSFGARRALGWIPFRQQSRRIEGNSLIYWSKRYRFWEGGRVVPENAKGGAFVEDAQGRWYVCFLIERDDRMGGTAEIGVDLGLKALATLSDGRKIEAPKVYRRHEQRLAVAQRAGNHRRVSALHAKIKNCRTDFLHKLSTELAREYALIAVGNVNAKSLAKTSMAKSVLDAGWSTLRQMLKYKSAGYIEVDEKFTTQACSGCGSIGGPKGIAGLEIRNWDCGECGASHDRDVNSALLILSIARSASRLVEGSRSSAQLSIRISTTSGETREEVGS
jgi:putative transposase